MPKRTRKRNALLKKLPEEVEAIRQAYPEASVELWSTDEHRIGLKPILRRVWALKGSAVKAVVAQRYEWMYVYACVHPESGRTSWNRSRWNAAGGYKLILHSFTPTPVSIGGHLIWTLLKRSSYDRLCWHTVHTLLNLLQQNPCTPS
jgi:hypothetical protein